MENKLIINKSFMSKTSCFKLQLSGKDCYIHTGKKNNDKWEWKKAKFNDDELGQLILFSTLVTKPRFVTHTTFSRITSTQYQLSSSSLIRSQPLLA